MKNLWKNEIEYVGVQLTPSEASIVSKVLGRLSRDNLNLVRLTKEERDIVEQLWVELSA